MKVLLVTGKLAEKMVRRFGKGAAIHVCDVDVAAFITPEMLKNLDLTSYDLVLVPGLTRGARWDILEREKGTKIRLGPLHAYDLQTVLKNVDKIEFSHYIPACRLIESVKIKETVEMVDELEKDFSFKIGEVAIGGKSRMKVVAEVAYFNSLEELREKIDHYVESGADIIDIGIPLDFDLDFISKAVKEAVNYTNLPVSIDTFSRKAIEIGIRCGVDMIMSISSKNLDAIDLIEEQAVVVVERDIDKLFRLIDLVERKTEKVIADPILDSPLRVAESITRYVEFRMKDPETPLLFGAGNVTELSDADSIGINALLAFIAEELGCNLLFTTEASPKTYGSVRELKIASYLAKASKIRDSPPKDAGVNLLVIKDKMRYESPQRPDEYVEAEESKEFIRDPKGDFIIYVSGDRIVCKHDKLTVIGKNAKEVVDTILRHGLVSRLDHAAYLGRELKKAEIAAILRKNYIQDRELDFGFVSRPTSNTALTGKHEKGSEKTK